MLKSQTKRFAKSVDRKWNSIPDLAKKTNAINPGRFARTPTVITNTNFRASEMARKRKNAEQVITLEIYAIVIPPSIVRCPACTSLLFVKDGVLKCNDARFRFCNPRAGLLRKEWVEAINQAAAWLSGEASRVQSMTERILNNPFLL
jgi:hypothetical protein